MITVMVIRVIRLSRFFESECSLIELGKGLCGPFGAIYRLLSTQPSEFLSIELGSRLKAKGRHMPTGDP